MPVRRQSPGEVVQSSLELHIRGPQGQVEVVPLHRQQIEHELGPGLALRFSLIDGEVRFRNLSQQPVYKDGQPLDSGRLEVGTSLEFAGRRLLLWDSGQPSAYLKGYSAPYSGEIWPLGPGQHPMGRPGRRSNAIQLDHPTVSREHATLIQSAEGGYQLLAESATNPVCLRGQMVAPGQQVDLQHGDLIEVGELVFRFHHPAPGAEAPLELAPLRVQSLGSLQAQVAGNILTDKAWKTQFIKWMFAHLAYEWGRPVGIEMLLEELWPEASPEKARNNFNYSLSTLRQILRNCLPEPSRTTEVVMRSSSTLQLNPDLLDEHDVVLLQRALASASAARPGWELQAEKAILGYSGPFLAECYLDWASSVRQSLELQTMEMARTLLESWAEQGKWEPSVPLATQLLKIDPLSQWPCLRLMQALRHCQRASEALKVFEQCRKQWHRELGLEPEVELLREHQRVLALL